MQMTLNYIHYHIYTQTTLNDIIIQTTLNDIITIHIQLTLNNITIKHT